MSKKQTTLHPKKTSSKSNIKHHVLITDSKNMKEIKSNSIHLTVTSPPYWNLKKYSGNGIGEDEAYYKYLDGLRQVFEEVKRVTKNGRFVVINIGTAVSKESMKPIHGDLIKIMNDLEFIFKKEIIWLKPKGTQGLWQRGTTKFLKKEPYPGYLSLNIQHEYILIFQKKGELRIQQDKTTQLSEEFIKKHAWSVWDMRVSYKKGHPAPFPEELPSRIIQLYSVKGETILDPFGGSGTTAKSCINLDRNSYTYEINEEYTGLIKENLSEIDSKCKIYDIKVR